MGGRHGKVRQRKTQAIVKRNLTLVRRKAKAPDLFTDTDGLYFQPPEKPGLLRIMEETGSSSVTFGDLHRRN